MNSQPQKPRLLPVHKVVEVGSPSRQTVRCAPAKLTSVVVFMMRHGTASTLWEYVTCEKCHEGVQRLHVWTNGRCRVCGIERTPENSGAFDCYGAARTSLEERL
jgi:uncharacterized protein YaeQ